MRQDFVNSQVFEELTFQTASIGLNQQINEDNQAKNEDNQEKKENKPGRILFLVFCLLIPVLGWIYLLCKCNYVELGKILVVTTMNGSTREYKATGLNVLSGIFPWESKHVVDLTDISRIKIEQYGNKSFLTVPYNQIIVLNNKKLYGAGIHIIETTQKLQQDCTASTREIITIGKIYYSNEQHTGYVFNDGKLERLPENKYLWLNKKLVAYLNNAPMAVSIEDQFSHTNHGKWDITLACNLEIDNIDKVTKIISEENENNTTIITDRLRDLLKKMLNPTLEKAANIKIEREVNGQKAIEEEALDKEDAKDMTNPAEEMLKEKFLEFGFKVNELNINLQPTQCNETMQATIKALQEKTVQSVRAKTELKRAETAANATVLQAKADAEANTLKAKAEAEVIKLTLGAKAVSAAEIFNKTGGSALATAAIITGRLPNSLGVPNVTLSN